MNGPPSGNLDYSLNGDKIKLDGNKTGIITDYAIEFLKPASNEKPFYLQVGYVATHSPYTGHDPDLVASYQKATFRDVEVEPQSPLAWNEGYPEDSEFTMEEARERHMNQYAAVTEIDMNVGRILDALDASGQAENTIVIYTSDHGLSLGGTSKNPSRA